MHGYLCARIWNLNPLGLARVAARLGLVIVATFAGSVGADDVSFGFAAGLGGTGYERGYGIAVDSSGNVYTTGFFFATVDFDPGAGTANLTSAGIVDIFVSKLDSAGNFVWAKAMGGTGHDAAFGIALDASGNVYATGVFRDTADFDPGAGTFDLPSAGVAASIIAPAVSFEELELNKVEEEFDKRPILKSPAQRALSAAAESR